MIKNYYLHLMDGKTAYYDKQDRCIYFMNKYHKMDGGVLCTSWKQLRHQQQVSEKTRAALHIDSSTWDMDYQRLPVEVAS